MKVTGQSQQVSDTTSQTPVQGTQNTTQTSSEGTVATQHEIKHQQTSEQQLGQEKHADLEFSGKMKAHELHSNTNAKAGETDKPATAQAAKDTPKTPAAQKVETAIEKARANGGGTREAVVAGAEADAGSINVKYGGITGEDRMREVFKNTGAGDLKKNQNYDRTGQPILPVKDGEKPISWCGVWATDIWKRSGCNCKWVPGQGPSDMKGKPLPRVDISGPKGQEKLNQVKPGDMIVTNSFEKDNPAKQKVNSTNHHALVTNVDYQIPGKADKITCPPAEVPKDGKVVGFHTMNGNSPSVPEADGSNPAIRKGYVDLTKPETEVVDGKTYSKRITNFYPVPEPQTQPVK